MLALESVTKRFGGLTAVGGVSLDVDEGDQIGRASCRERV